MSLFFDWKKFVRKFEEFFFCSSSYFRQKRVTVGELNKVYTVGFLWHNRKRTIYTHTHSLLLTHTHLLTLTNTHTHTHTHIYTWSQYEKQTRAMFIKTVSVWWTQWYFWVIVSPGIFYFVRIQEMWSSSQVCIFSRLRKIRLL